MAQNNKSSEKQSIVQKIRVRLDHKTIITIKDMAKLAFWKQRYPNAVVMD